MKISALSNDVPTPGHHQPSIHITPLDEGNCRLWIPGEDEYVLLFVQKAQGSYRNEGGAASIDNGHFLFSQPGSLQYVLLSHGGAATAIHFSQSGLQRAIGGDLLFQKLIQQLAGQANAIPLRQETAPNVYQTLDLMVMNAVKSHLNQVDILFAYLKILLLYITDIPDLTVATPRLNRNQQLVAHFFDLIDDHFRHWKQVADYAEKLAVTPNYLNEVIKKETGQSAGLHIRSRVVREAQQQAAHSELGMKAIAFDLGFFDTAHFSKFFKNTTGYNFSDFKKMDRRAMVH